MWNADKKTVCLKKIHSYISLYKMYIFTIYPVSKNTCLCPALFLKTFAVTFCLFMHYYNNVTRNNFGSNFDSTSAFTLVRKIIVQSWV